MLQSLKIENVTYEFNPEDEYQGHTFISIKKSTQLRKFVKYQRLTIKSEHWEKFREWFWDILENSE